VPNIVSSPVAPTRDLPGTLLIKVVLYLLCHPGAYPREKSEFSPLRDENTLERPTPCRWAAVHGLASGRPEPR
jgi:hypothetical protein